MKLITTAALTTVISFTSLTAATKSSLPTEASSGCAKTSLPDNVKLGESKSVNITSTSVNGTSSIRKYRIHVPKSYKHGVPVPLILSFHGRSKTAKDQEKLSQFSNEAFGFEGIAVYPQGLAPNKTNQWQGDPSQPSTINDIHFTLELLSYLTTNYCIDRTSMYASGKSNGGGFTGLLACDPSTSRQFAAFAAVSGAFYLDRDTQKLPPCNPALSDAKTAIPFMELHGALDETIKYAGGENKRGNARSVDVFSYVEDWVRRDGLDGAGVVEATVCEAERLVQSYKWGDTVQHYKYANMGHDWMSEFGNADSETNRTCREADATRLILEWFAKWRSFGRV